MENEGNMDVELRPAASPVMMQSELPSIVVDTAACASQSRRAPRCSAVADGPSVHTEDTMEPLHAATLVDDGPAVRRSALPESGRESIHANADALGEEATASEQPASVGDGGDVMWESVEDDVEADGFVSNFLDSPEWYARCVHLYRSCDAWWL